MRSNRKHLSISDKLSVVVRQANCSLCGEPIEDLKNCDFDHVVAIALGGADDIENLRAVHRLCHAVKTNGKAHVKIGADKHEIARAKRLSDAHAMLAELNKDRAAARELKRQEKSKWPKQKFKRRASK